MSENLREQIRNSLSQKEIYELLDIWKTNDRLEWSDTAFDVLREILRERIGRLPPQDEPVLNRKGPAKEKFLEDWEVKLLEEANQPDFYHPQRVLELRDHINKVAKGAIVVYVALALLDINFVRSFIQQIPFSYTELLQSFPYTMINILIIGAQLAMVYFPLKALSHILRILMQMEFNSRLDVKSN